MCLIINVLRFFEFKLRYYLHIKDESREVKLPKDIYSVSD